VIGFVIILIIIIVAATAGGGSSTTMDPVKDLPNLIQDENIES
jgi:hypothetical protein